MHEIEVMGTVVVVDLRGQPPTGELVAEGVRAVEQWLRWVDETFSPFKPSSEISRINRGEVGRDDCHPLVVAVLERCEALRRATGGFFDVVFGPEGHVDPCGYVKGWSIDHAAALLIETGFQRFSINAGGDIRIVDTSEAHRPWRVGITHPFDRQALAAVIDVRRGAVATSGLSERGLHIFDPHTKRPTSELSSVTVVGGDLTTADAMATAAFAMGVKSLGWLESLTSYDAYVIDSTGHEWMSRGFSRRRVDLLSGSASLHGGNS